MSSFLTAIVVLVLGVVIGELIFRRKAEGPRILGDISLALHAMVYFIIAVIFVLGGAFVEPRLLIVGFLMVILYWSLFRTKTDDLLSRDLRSMINVW